MGIRGNFGGLNHVLSPWIPVVFWRCVQQRKVDLWCAAVFLFLLDVTLAFSRLRGMFRTECPLSEATWVTIWTPIEQVLESLDRHADATLVCDV